MFNPVILSKMTQGRAFFNKLSASGVAINMELVPKEHSGGDAFTD